MWAFDLVWNIMVLVWSKQGRIVTALKTIQANNPTVAISFTLPVMPEGLTQDGKNMVKQAINAGLNFQLGIMTMDYGVSYCLLAQPSYDCHEMIKSKIECTNGSVWFLWSFSNQSSYAGNQATHAINAADNTVAFLQTVYPSKTSAQLYGLIINIPMIGVNDQPQLIFTLPNADALNSYAKTKGFGGLSMWSLNRYVNWNKWCKTPIFCSFLLIVQISYVFSQNRDHPCADSTASNTCSGGNVQTANYDFCKHLGA